MHSMSCCRKEKRGWSTKVPGAVLAVETRGDGGATGTQMVCPCPNMTVGVGTLC